MYSCQLCDVETSSVCEQWHNVLFDSLLHGHCVLFMNSRWSMLITRAISTPCCSCTAVVYKCFFQFLSSLMPSNASAYRRRGTLHSRMWCRVLLIIHLSINCYTDLFLKVQYYIHNFCLIRIKWKSIYWVERWCGGVAVLC